jgi:NAD(P)H-nitrite reductase large subunit
MAPRHVVVGGGTAGWNAIRTIRELDGGASEITLVSAERPYSRMVLPYYLSGGIAEARVFTAAPALLARLGVQARTGRRAAGLDGLARRLTLDDGSVLEYDTLLVATGSSALRPPVPGADGPGVHTFWTLEQAREVVAGIRPGTRVAMVGAGFIAFTILNAILSLGAGLTVVELAPHILPRMIDAEAAGLVESRLRGAGVEVHTGARVAEIRDEGGGRRLVLDGDREVSADLVILATGIRPNLDWLAASGVRINQGILVDDHQRASVPSVYAAGDVAEGHDLVTGAAAVHAIEPTAMEQGRVAGANMAGWDVAYRGSLLMNIVEVQDLEIASFGAWADPDAEATAAVRADRQAYRKLLWRGDRLIGAILVGPARDVWTTNDLGMLKGLVQSGRGLGPWRARLAASPFNVKPAFVAAGTTGHLLPQTILGRPSRAPEEAGRW